MKKFCFLFFLCCLTNANAQNYLVSFTGTGEATTVSTVKVENLTANTNLTMNGSEVLRLSMTAGYNTGEYNRNAQLKIYPNPMKDYSFISFNPSVEGNAVVSVLDMAGRIIGRNEIHLDNM